MQRVQAGEELETLAASTRVTAPLAGRGRGARSVNARESSQGYKF